MSEKKEVNQPPVQPKYDKPTKKSEWTEVTQKTLEEIKTISAENLKKLPGRKKK